MPSLISQLESLLLLATKPMKKKELLKATAASEEVYASAVAGLKDRYNREGSGMNIIDHDEALQFVTSAENTQLVEKVYQSEMTGELTKPALETLTIVAYRGPINKPELELIRGINCSLILRNLAMRGLIDEQVGEDGIPRYSVHPEFLQYLGLTSVQDLPNYQELSRHQLLEELLKQRQQTVQE